MTSKSSERIYDIAIIGGGIAGAGIARDAALRGLKVALFEKNTFASGTSSKSSKLIHGGIRYLEVSWENLKKGNFLEAWKNFRFVFASLRESRILARTASLLVRPLPLVIPLYNNGPRNPLSVYFGAYLYFFLSLFSGGSPVPRVFAKKADILKLVPGIRSEDLTGAVRIWDYGVDDKALVLAVIASALKAGGVAYEHAEVTHYRLDKSKNLYELRIRREGREEILFARKIVNAAGPWVDKVRRSVDQTVPKFIDAIGGSHIELASFLPESIILRAKDGRIFFVICRGERARVGTTEWPCADPDHVAVPESDIDYLLESLNFYFPEKKFSRRDILSVDAGIRPLFYFGQSRSASQIPREHELRFGPDGVLHVIGVKLTDHRRAAEEAVDMILGAMNLKRKSLTSRTALV